LIGHRLNQSCHRCFERVFHVRSRVRHRA
jgi:hypothetical protein